MKTHNNPINADPAKHHAGLVIGALWAQGEEKMRKGELIINAMVFAPLLIGLFLFPSIGLYYRMPKIAFWVMAALFLLGFALFAKAKFSIIKQGQLFTFGPSKMSKSNRISYFLGYGGMILGLFLLIGFGFAV